jgi:ATP-dependent DNA helicase RecG
MPVVTWDSKLSAVAGKGAAKIEKAFGYRTVGELLRHYPRRYVDKGSLSDLGQLTLDEHITVIARVRSAKQIPYQDRRRGGWAYRLEVVVSTEQDDLTLTFFDKRKHIADWRARTVVPGTTGLFSGKVGTFRGRWQLVNPESKIFGAGSPEHGAAEAHAAFELEPNLLTIYPATSTVQSWQIQDAIEVALALVEDIPEPLPEELRKERNLVGAREALQRIHRPDSWAEKSAAEKRLRFEEAFVTQAVLAQRRALLRQLDARPRTGRPAGLLDRFDERLPFQLTRGQRTVGEDILADLAAGHPMHRLLQGEVGSGKTVVALRAMLRGVDSGGQAALLAPTEVLAQQHHRSVTELLGDLAAGGMLGGADDATQVGLLTGSMGAAARKAVLADVASGAAGIVIGTHALLQEQVAFDDLGLVVVDEQHRFGVEQRAALTAKAGETPPHVLVMTATPIPRTVAMTVFGDLETSSLTELPAGRAAVQTTVVPVLEQPSWVDRAWARVREEVAEGRQAYVVCARIGGSTGASEEEPDVPPGDDEQAPPEAVEELAPALAEGPLAGLTVAALHGRMAAEAKDQVMRAFASGQIDVLVSTTVIEVGVDVPNAAVMVVMDADRFGVSALHQLRGRIGRGRWPGLCLLVTRSPGGSPARDRLDAVASTTDGFALSQVDLEQRREGDVLGTSQSGRRSSLRLLSVLRDEDVIGEARECATVIVDQDPELAAHPELAAAIRRLDEADQAAFLGKA